MFNFFVVPGKGQALLGMPNIDTFNIININCNTIDAHRTDSVDSCGKTQPSARVQGMCNTTQT